MYHRVASKTASPLSTTNCRRGSRGSGFRRGKACSPSATATPSTCGRTRAGTRGEPPV